MFKLVRRFSSLRKLIFSLKGRNNISYFILVIFFSILLNSCQTDKETKLRIAASSNTQYALAEIISEFETKYSLKCELVLGSSGKLTAQILQGAPFDVFLSADLKYPKHIYSKGQTLNKPRIYAFGELVLCSTTDSIKDIKDLISIDKKRIAIANPEFAPYGRAALESLSFYDILDSIKPKIVYGENISQVNQFISSKSVNAGFTSLSTIKAANNILSTSWIKIDPKSHSKISQGVVVLKNSENIEAAELFIEFLFSKKAREIFKDFGYLVNE